MQDQDTDLNLGSWIQWVLGLLSLGLCTLALYARFPYMTLLGLSPNWLLIWLVVWSLKRPVFLAVIMGICLGFIQDAMTIPSSAVIAPTHAIGMAITAGLTALMQKERYIQEDFISIALIVFGMTIISETAIALQLTVLGQSLAQVWQAQQQITLGSAILTSLWSPVLHFTLRLKFVRN
ncbi:rod shape-determining protein MreD [Synechococcus sp. PCC 7502]|uniref:rod shape-determining protein MreD n=1 Tax=Synechococcus sp. PCC 7502 TaxID=1173263 RepID=UPI00029FB637|nr:rod shape-determining protein MreD [Synechococcus sp. PCC 7502]AFY75315.1 rod shape-determining protein MreD [Synechococcus sp. PCC 7502]